MIFALVRARDAWPNARDQDDIIRLGMFNGKGNCVTPVANFMCALGTYHDVSTDERRVFAPWVVVCDDHNVRIRHRNRTHFRTLASVAVTAGTEYGDKLALGMRA